MNCLVTNPKKATLEIVSVTISSLEYSMFIPSKQFQIHLTNPVTISVHAIKLYSDHLLQGNWTKLRLSFTASCFHLFLTKNEKRYMMLNLHSKCSPKSLDLNKIRSLIKKLWRSVKNEIMKKKDWICKNNNNNYWTFHLITTVVKSSSLNKTVCLLPEPDLSFARWKEIK